MDNVEEVNIRDIEQVDKINQFLKKNNLQNFKSNIDFKIDKVFAIFSLNGNQVLATGSVSGNIIEYVAVSNEGELNRGSRFNKIMTSLLNYLASTKIFHVFVFTKIEYKNIFSSIGFSELVRGKKGLFMERGRPNILDYTEQLQKSIPISPKVASVVINANPFTLGHKYLIERASKDSDIVVVFVLSSENSLFSFEERISLVREGVEDFKNVYIVSGGDYIVSFTTFPSYFLKSSDDEARFQTEIDANIFKNWIVPSINISSRFLGEEPLSPVTLLYNKTIQEILSDDIDIHIVKRIKKSERIISASLVRQKIAENKLSEISELVPPSTFNFIEKNIDILKKRIDLRNVASYYKN